MELEPMSENGMCLYKMLSDWRSRSPGTTKDLLTRVLLICTIKIENSEHFVDALYGQRVLEEPHWDLTKERPTILYRVRHAIGTTVSKSRVKELVMALDWSKNETVLGEILKWAGDAGSREITEAVSALSNVDLSPQRAPKTFRSLRWSPDIGEASQRERMVDLNGGTMCRFAVCRNCNSIIVGLYNSQIKIYNNVKLQCHTVLPSLVMKTETFVCGISRAGF